MTTPRPTADATGNDDRWTAVLARDVAADGTFVYAVATTGIYCRPTCPSRRPKRQNVSFFASSAEAEQAGFRACLRCHPQRSGPNERNAERIADLCRYIEHCDHTPRLDELADRAGLSAWHLHRLFKKVVGVTPAAYARRARDAEFAHQLRTGSSVTGAIYAAGYSSSSRAYDGVDERLGMTPGQRQRGGKGTRIRFTTRRCSLGIAIIAATDRGLCHIALGDSSDELVAELQQRFAAAEFLESDPEFERLVTAVLAHVEDSTAPADLPFDVRGSAFQIRVWQALTEVRAGETVTYAELAARIDSPGASRAVANACAANPLAVVVPCHRVVRSDGQLSGYRWGVDRKRALLDRESQPDCPEEPAGR